MQYEISIRIDFPEDISAILRKEKERFVTEYGSGYKSEPHITLYLDSYTEDGFPQLLHDLRGFRMEPFVISLLEPKARHEERRSRYLYVMEISNKEKVSELHGKVSEVAIRYRSPLLREKTRKRFEQQGITTDGTRERLEAYNFPEEPFDPHVTLGEVGFDAPRPDLAKVQSNLKQLEDKKITITDMTASFYGKQEGDEKFKLIKKVVIPFEG